MCSQSVQLELPGLEKVPSGQISQPLPSSFNFAPAAHLLQSTEPSKLLKVPGTQLLHKVDWAALENFPIAHEEQRIVPGVSEWVPAGQLGQIPRPEAGADLPSRQAGQGEVWANAGLAVPATQLRQSDSIVLLVVVE